MAIVNVSRNFGMRSRWRRPEPSYGNAAIVIDADLPDPPELIPPLIGAAAQGESRCRFCPMPVVCRESRRRKNSCGQSPWHPKQTHRQPVPVDIGAAESSKCIRLVRLLRSDQWIDHDRSYDPFRQPDGWLPILLVVMLFPGGVQPLPLE